MKKFLSIAFIAASLVACKGGSSEASTNDSTTAPTVDTPVAAPTVDTPVVAPADSNVKAPADTSVKEKKAKKTN